jgi:hypothetical protein
MREGLMPPIEKKLESIGKIIAGGFGDRVAIGAAVGLLQYAKPERAYIYIRDNKRLLDAASPKQLKDMQKMAHSAPIDRIKIEDVLERLRKKAPDVWCVITSHPKGKTWLQAQIDDIKKTIKA